MRFNYVGRSGLRVSNICLGTMTFGKKVGREDSLKILDGAYESGVNFYDTAEVYPVPPTTETAGITETIFGEWLSDKPRESVIVATKVAGAANGWFIPPIRYGLTAIDSFHIERAVEGSLRRLRTDYIDLYQVHWPDLVVPVEESLKALNRLVESGKVRYIGVSNENAYGLTKALMTSQFKGLARYESIQNNFSLLNRRFLDELANVCKGENVSLLPYSPIAGGVLSGKYVPGSDWSKFRYGEYGALADSRMQAQTRRFAGERSIAAATRYADLARQSDLTPAEMSLAWSLSFSFVPSTIIGVTSLSQLEENLKAAEVTLSQEILKKCDEIHSEILYPMG